MLFKWFKVHCDLGPVLSLGLGKGLSIYCVIKVAPSLGRFVCLGCYGTLGMESGVIADSQINASSFLEWPEQVGQPSTWRPERARLKRPGHSWAAFTNDEYQWLQIDLNKEQRITGKHTCVHSSKDKSPLLAVNTPMPRGGFRAT